MAQCLRVLVILLEDLGPIRWLTIVSNSSTRRYSALFWLFQATGHAHDTQTSTQTKHLYT